MIYTSGWPDYHEMHFMKRYLRSGDRFVDVGANIGIFTLLAASLVGSEGQVVSYEPNEQAFNVLSENISINNLEQVRVRRCAIGDLNGTVMFLKNRGLTNRILTPRESSNDVECEEVHCAKLDTVLEGQVLAMGKIDIEGAEPIAFQGAEQSLLLGNPAVWMVEMKDHLLRRFNCSAEELAGTLTRHGYRLAAYDADTHQLGFGENVFAAHDNVLAIHETSLDVVRQRLASYAADG